MNLIGSRPDGWWHDPDRAIRRLADELDAYAAATGEDVTVVFDRPPAGARPESRYAAVVYAPWRGPNAADHEIVRIVSEDPEPATFRVVTSDRRLLERVRELGAASESPTSFRRRLTASLQAGPEP
jgi:predicted RNA-binding protein with PIN domain